MIKIAEKQARSPAEVDEIMQRVKELDLLLKQTEDSRKIALAAWAEAVCPYSVCDVVECAGYAYEGSLCVVDEIVPSTNWRGDYEWTVKATVLAKNGTRSKNSCMFTASQFAKYKPVVG
jgi:hypothetical protein